MASRGDETLTQLIAEVAGTRGKGLTYEQLAERSIDPKTKYRPSANLLNRIGRGESVKLNQPLIAAITAGLGLPPARVEAAATRQFIGYAAIDPGLGGGGDDDEVIRAARPAGTTPRDDGEVEGFVRRSREEGTPEQR